jgi:hypothetical protein
MNNKFVSDNFQVPEKLETNKFLLRPLTANDAAKDYEAVMSSVDYLRTVPTPPICGDWPEETLTREEDLEDLKWHEKTHKSREIFTYTVMNLDESRCLGCVYIFPSDKIGYDTMIFSWVIEEEAKKGLDQELYETVKNWLKTSWPFTKTIFPGRDISWEVWNGFKNK